MPLYEYYCRRCQGRFELLRPVARMDEAAACPEGHAGGERVLSTFTAMTRGEDGVNSFGGGGGCGGCGGGNCACSSLN